ncbi:MAG: hypothetical protein P8H39_12350 [Thalassotalea sp.]|nr:hypothetical protein [Thalassotalea sp.]
MFMPPELIHSNYRKNLDEPPTGASDEIKSSSFYLAPSGHLYQLHHRLITGSSLDGCVEVFEMVLFSGNEAYLVDHMLPSLEGKSKEDAIQSLLDFQMHEKSTNCIARVAYSKTNVATVNKSLLGAQIKGAFVDDEYSGDGIASFIYDWLLDSFGCVISDNQQTQEGAGLWAYKFSTKYDDLHVYDQTSKQYYGALTSNLLKQTGESVWSTNTLTAVDVAEEDYSVSFEDCHNKTVLFFIP